MQRKRSKWRGARQTQETIRQRAVGAIKRGRSIKEVAETFGVSGSAVRDYNKKHQSGGPKTLLSARRGREIGEKRSSSARQESQLRRWIIDPTPD